MKEIKKIVIMGNAGAGKSTLALKLSEKLSIPVFHLDKILWKENWERTPEEEFTQKHNEILEKGSWILDGVAYKSTYEHRFEKTDAIIYLDISPEVCFEHAKKRMEEDLVRPNPFVNKNCPYGMEYSEQQRELIYSIHEEYRPLILGMIKKFEDRKLVIYLEENFDYDALIVQLKGNSK